MKFTSMKLAGALLASISIACAGPAWSSSAPKKHVKSVANHKVKAKAKARQNHVMVASVAVPAVAAAVAVPVFAETGYAPAMPAGNPYLAYQQPMAPANPWNNASQLIDNVKSALPSLPGSNGRSILPTLKKVYPTGEKPLVVLTLNCPTELIGISTPPIKALHGLVDVGFDAVNSTNLLSFNLQQVCQ